MRIRKGFVSNSSSCSFIIPKSELTESQKEAMLNVREVANKINTQFERVEMEGGDFFRTFAVEYFEEDWNGDRGRIWETEDMIKGVTSCDNFGMVDYMRMIGIDTSKIQISDDYGKLWGEINTERENKFAEI